jgi:uncharacterized membrane protein YfcA
VIIYSVKKQNKWKIALKIAIFGCLGAVAGFYLAKLLGGGITAKIFGVILIVMGIFEIFKKAEK